MEFESLLFHDHGEPLIGGPDLNFCGDDWQNICVPDVDSYDTCKKVKCEPSNSWLSCIDQAYQYNNNNVRCTQDELSFFDELYLNCNTKTMLKSSANVNNQDPLIFQDPLPFLKKGVRESDIANLPPSKKKVKSAALNKTNKAPKSHALSKSKAKRKLKASQPTKKRRKSQFSTPPPASHIPVPSAPEKDESVMSMRKEPNYRSLVKTNPSKYEVKAADGSVIMYLCPFPGCSRKMKGEEELETHMDLHKEGEKRHFRCEQCGDVFYSSGCLKSHKITHIRKTGDYTCKEEGCGKKYSTAEGLRLHTRNHHENSKKWKCMSESCVRSFVRQSDLRMHIIRMHSKERPFPCESDNCRKAFACHSELRRHMHTCHKIVCPKLGKEAARRPDSDLMKRLLEKAALYQQQHGTGKRKK